MHPLAEPTLLTAAILGLVEGLTEFLPVSSTGHLIVAASLLDYTGEKAKLFEIVIQAGAILAVCWEYRHKLIGIAAGIFSDRGAQRFAINLGIAFLPAAILGLAFGRAILTGGSGSRWFSPMPASFSSSRTIFALSAMRMVSGWARRSCSWGRFATRCTWSARDRPSHDSEACDSLRGPC